MSALRINRVGIRGVKLPPVKMGDYWAIPAFNAFVDLSEDYRGAHISRIYKIVYESFSEYSYLDYKLLEMVASRLLELHEGSSKADTFFRARLIANVPGQEYKSSRSIVGRLVVGAEGKKTFYSGVEFQIVTACPCALEVSKHLYSKPYTHNAIMKVLVLVRSDNLLPHPVELLSTLQKVFAEPSNYLNRIGEAEMVRKVAEQPRFAEDVAREAAKSVISAYSQVIGSRGRVYARVTSIEPFHEYKISVKLSTGIS